ncbi:MAG: HD domain-containing protein [Myxococcales bacterium]|nr:HD domain-containing protein [Myxococcales bacterium]
MSYFSDLPELQGPTTLSIRDPLHKSIELSEAEMGMLRDPAYQRLRGIKQIGFAEIPYPGATHTRYLHSIGVGAVATRMWRTLQRSLQLDPADSAQLLRILRAAAMLHDVGHAPLSHTTESVMPSREKLDMPAWLVDPDPTRQAHHEDYSLKIILDSPITPHLEAMGVAPTAVAQLISGVRLPEDHTFHHQGFDLFPMMRQIISSEIDADRMDYLLRDAFYCGVAYGQFDLDWMLQHITPIFRDQKAYLGLRSRALFTFEDFLLSRYHMFFSVYYHHGSICYQEMLQRFFLEEPDAYPLPSDLEAYLRTDDAELLTALRRSKNPWAQRITQHRPYLRLFEILLPHESSASQPSHVSSLSSPLQPLEDGPLPPRIVSSMPQNRINSIQLYSTLPEIDPQLLHEKVAEALQDAKIPMMQVTSRWVLSRYFRQPNDSEPPIYVLDDSLQATLPIQQYSHLYRRYAQAQSLRRIYCHSKYLERAQELVQKLVQSL